MPSFFARPRAQAGVSVVAHMIIILRAIQQAASALMTPTMSTTSTASTGVGGSASPSSSTLGVKRDVEVQRWLAGLGLDQLAALFHGHQITHAMLPELDRNYLQRIGVLVVGHQVRNHSTHSQYALHVYTCA